MTLFELNKDFFNKPIRLTPEQENYPQDVIEDFFDAFHLYEIREHLSQLQETALTKETDFFAEAYQRGGVAVFIERLEKMIEASYSICRAPAKNS